jgi:peptide/nickel transport system permease protein
MAKKSKLNASTLSQAKLVSIRFFRHKLAVAGLAILAALYLSALFASFLSPNDPAVFYDQYLYCPPQSIHFKDDKGFSFRPFYYPLTSKRDPRTLEMKHVQDTDQRLPVHFFVKSFDYKLFGFIKTNIHLLGGEEGHPIFIFGTDKMGRDLFARNLYAGRISLTIGLVGVAITFIMGCILGGISGYYGGKADMIIQRIIEFLMSIPTLPLWMALSAALPREWSQLQLYFAITIILAISGWTGLARVVRGKIMSIKSEDYVTAAILSGAPDRNLITTHLLPGFAGYLIVNITLSIPGMILGETALSFLGLGLQAPTISWGVLLGDAQSIKVISMNPWIMIPSISVILTVLAYNFVGDGLRDALDPYKGY